MSTTIKNETKSSKYVVCVILSESKINLKDKMTWVHSIPKYMFMPKVILKSVNIFANSKKITSFVNIPRVGGSKKSEKIIRN